MIADLQRLLSRVTMSILSLLPVCSFRQAQSVSVTDSLLNSAGYTDESFLIADVDKDGHSDLLESYWGVSYGKYPAVNPGLGPGFQERKGNGLRWYKGPELKTITTILTGTQYQSPEYWGFFVEDFDRDGGMDFLGYRSHTILLIRNIADTRPKTIQTINTTPHVSLRATGDLNRDGYPDLVATTEYDLCWLENKMGTGTTFTLHTVRSFMEGGASLVADLDRDGNQDILVTGDLNNGPTSIFLYRNKGGKNPVFTENILTTGSGVREVLDFDHDGDPDIIVSGSEGIDWLENNGGSPPKFARHHLLDEGPYGKFCDLDGDGDLDILGIEYIRHSDWRETDDVYLFYQENQGGSPPSFKKYRLKQLCVSTNTYPWPSWASGITGTAVGQLRGNPSWQIVVGRSYNSDRYYDSTYHNYVVDQRGDIYVYSTNIPVRNGVVKKLWDRYR